MFLELDGEGSAYTQLARALKAAILNGRLASDSKLPSTRALAKEIGVARITVLSAYEQLQAEGYISCRAGSGCRVNVLQTIPKLPAPNAKPVAPQSRYAQRARDVRNWRIARQHQGLRFDLQYYQSNANPAFNTAWSGELARAAKFNHGYSGSQGLLALREQLCIYLARRRGVRASPENVLIVNGAQQAFDLTARVLLDEGCRVAIEEPHYFGMWNAFACHGAQLQPIRTDSEGLVCAELPKKSPRLICVTPSHQFPAGAVLSLSRRLDLLRYANDQRCWIVEDDYDSELRYGSPPLAALRSLDHGTRVIYIGTFSKVLSGSLRLGYMVIPAALQQDFINAKYLCDMGGPAIEQAALAHFIQTGRFERHLRQLSKTLRSRREVLLDELHRHCGGRIQIDDSQAGMHVVVWLPTYDHAQVDTLIENAHQRGLGLYSMAPHYHTRPPTPGLMLGYCGLSVTELRKAIHVFGQCLDAIDVKRSN